VERRVISPSLVSTQFAGNFCVITLVSCYSDAAWQDVSIMCREAGVPVGNSSAANLAVSRFLAQKGRTVFTFLYEPLREFYLSSKNHPVMGG
jgi:cysteine synthase